MGKPPWPKLSSTLPHPRHPERCQACSGPGDHRWQEHDEDDRPTPVIVVLCAACGDRLIEPHPRLYRELDAHEPAPGCMPICVGCTVRDGVACGHPDLKANGGPGLRLQYPAPTHGFWDGRTKGGRRTGGRLTIYHGPVRSCAGRDPQPALTEETRDGSRQA